MQSHEMAGAVISECRRYRYRLWRRWGRGPQALWIMLNPSTADDRFDDPTIRRCAKFSQAWRCDGLEVVNLFALRATDPGDLLQSRDPHGPMNDSQLRMALRGTWKHVVVAWGRGAALPREFIGSMERYIQRLDRRERMECLGVTKDGHPRHPLYVPKATELQSWPRHNP